MWPEEEVFAMVVKTKMIYKRHSRLENIYDKCNFEWVVISHRICTSEGSFSGYLEMTTATVVPCGGHRLSLNRGLGGVRDVVLYIISHEHTQPNQVCCFQ